MVLSDESTPTWLDLYDYRKRVEHMYRVRNESLATGGDAQTVLRHFRASKDRLFAEHPQSALSPVDRRSFTGLRYFPYDPAYRVEVELTPLVDDEEDQSLPASGAHAMRFRRAARITFTLDGAPQQLLVYWIDVYGGGLFLPFRDATSGSETYGGGRYLFDTVKGSDFERLDSSAAAMGLAGGPIMLDFNYAYNPSCAYDARWVCPLAPNENRLPVAVRVGELAWYE
jgi:uncharacterized protein (DUF1684 family)